MSAPAVPEAPDVLTEAAPPEAGVKRRNYGRGHGYRIDGVKVPGVTKICGYAPKDGLINWAGNSTADYALDNWDALATLPPAKRLAKMRGARYEDKDTAAKRGTQVHRLGAAMIAGQSVDVPEELAGHVDSYCDFLDRCTPVIVAVELIVANRTERYCGTLDIIADLPPLMWAGEIIPAGRWLLDVKTSRSGIFGETALQLCGYEHAEIFIDPETGAERPMSWLKVEYTGAVHVRGDGWDLRPTANTDAVWRYFRHLAYLCHNDDDLGEWIGEAVMPPALIAAAAAPK